MEDLGFKKIEFGEPQEALSSQDNLQEGKIVSSGLSKKNNKSFNKTLLFAFLSLLIIIIGFCLIVFVKGKIVYSAYKRTNAQAQLALVAFKKQNIFLAKEELVKTQDDLNSLKSSFMDLSMLGFIPLLNSYYNDAGRLVNAATYGVSSAITVTDSLIPYADVLGLKGEKSFVQGTAEDRIRLAVATMDKVVTKIDDIEVQLIKAKNEVDGIKMNKYPNFGPFVNLRNKINEAKTLVDSGVVSVQEGKPLIKVLPELLGNKGSKQYLILFQNDKELRPTGGFITFYAVFRVEQGIMHIDSASDIYNLDDSIAVHPKAPDIILKYLPKVYTLNIRDSNLSPDYAVSMQAFNALYEKSSSKKKIDGIIALDTHVLTSVLNILGDVTAGGITFNAKNDPRCNCPQVVYTLESFADQPVGHLRADRKSVVGELLYAIMQRSLASSPKLYWGKLLQQGMREAQEKHILFYLLNKNAQQSLEALNVAGRIKDFNGDYLHINDANFGGAKSNMYVQQSVKMEYNLDNSGAINKTVTITYKNPYPYSDCNLERGGLCLNAILRDFLRVYVPKGSILLESQGSEVKVETKEDLGKTDFEAFLTVNPLGKSEISFRYRLPFNLKNGVSLPVLIQKQPGTNAVPYEIFVNNKKINSFDLNTDQILNLNF